MSPHRPTPHVWVWGRLRVIRWTPRCFWSISWLIHDKPAPVNHFRGWQIYLGWGKCDGTQTARLNQGAFGEPTPGYVLTWTIAEMGAIRRRDLDDMPIYSNMGGA